MDDMDMNEEYEDIKTTEGFESVVQYRLYEMNARFKAAQLFLEQHGETARVGIHAATRTALTYALSGGNA